MDYSNRTHISFLLDASGSMDYAEAADNLRKGFNEFCESLKHRLMNKYLISLAQFGHYNGWYYRDFEGVDVNVVPELNKVNYVPSGGTPLSRATTKVIHEALDFEREHPVERTMIIVFTDGGEGYYGSDRQLTVGRLISNQFDDDTHKVAMISLGHDAADVAKSYNIKLLVKGDDGLGKAFQTLTEEIVDMAKGT